jgi:NDP-sugar pyrophosphorylase family protein
LGLKNVVLLAAGSGSRLAPLTDTCHKSLLPICGKSPLQMILDSILAAGASDIVVVTGHRHMDVVSFIRDTYGDTVSCVFNQRYKEDVNILSVDIGVDALSEPSAGYMIIETDLVIEPAGWKRVLDIGEHEASFWVTRGHYSPTMTGGALDVDDMERVKEIVYQPHYDSIYSGWRKLLGILYVGSDAVMVDRRLRKAAIHRNISQYYMMPWVENIGLLPCFSRDLGELFAVSYNDIEAYNYAAKEYSRIQNKEM